MIDALLAWLNDGCAEPGNERPRLTGGIVALCLLVLRRKGRKEAIPFGPFLALGGAITLLWGEPRPARWQLELLGTLLPLGVS